MEKIEKRTGTMLPVFLILSALVAGVGGIVKLIRVIASFKYF